MDVTERKRTEEELRKSEERYRELFNNMSSGVAVYEAVENGQNFIFKDFNQSGERIENIRKDDLLGKSVVKMFPGVRDFGLFEVFQLYRILVVEDHLENRLFLTQLLQTVGFEVHEATNGQEALKHYESWQPHLIWMDIRMPVMDGYAATRKIRKAEEQKLRRAGEKPTPHPSQEGNQSDELQASIPIIALTASASEEDRKHLLEAGCDDVVRKPLQEHEIFEMIHTYLGVRYVYEESSKVASSKIAGSRKQEGEQQVLTPEAAALPGDVVANLEHATLDGDVKLIDQVIHEIHNHNAALADALAHLAHEFDYDTILKLIQEGKNYKNQE